MALEHGRRGTAEKLAQQELLVYDRDRPCAVLVIDTLNDFVTGALKRQRIVPKVSHVVELVDSARGAGVPVERTDCCTCGSNPILIKFATVR